MTKWTNYSNKAEPSRVRVSSKVPGRIFKRFLPSVMFFDTKPDGISIPFIRNNQISLSLELQKLTVEPRGPSLGRLALGAVRHMCHIQPTPIKCIQTTCLKKRDNLTALNNTTHGYGMVTKLLNNLVFNHSIIVSVTRFLNKICLKNNTYMMDNVTTVTDSSNYNNSVVNMSANQKGRRAKFLFKIIFTKSKKAEGRTFYCVFSDLMQFSCFVAVLLSMEFYVPMSENNDSNVFNPEEHPHLRYNPLLDESVLVSPHRLKRPWKGGIDPPPKEDISENDPNNPLCPGATRPNGVLKEAFSDDELIKIMDEKDSKSTVKVNKHDVTLFELF
ncbi:Galactose-1-phosphate uridylyltransferase [Nymphon striatum]|nr:Galactose-1-phosphate uridylyltransferase [Nymphon striatum]